MNTMQVKHCCTTPAMSGKTIVRENCVHADVVRVFCALLEKICLFVNFLPNGFYFGLVYCSVVSAFVPHLEFLFFPGIGDIFSFSLLFSLFAISVR